MRICCNLKSNYCLLIIENNMKIIKKIYIHLGTNDIDLKIGIYKLYFITNDICYIIPIIVRDCNEYFIINLNYNNKKRIKLTDKFYKNLKIMKGEIILWQENIK